MDKKEPRFKIEKLEARVAPSQQAFPPGQFPAGNPGHAPGNSNSPGNSGPGGGSADGSGNGFPGQSGPGNS